MAIPWPVNNLTRWALVCAVLCDWCGQASGGHEEISIRPLVETFRAEQRTLPEWSEYPGIVGSREVVNVIALVAGRVKAVHVKAGQAVQKGDLLLELEPDEFQARLAAAKAWLAASQAHRVVARLDHERTLALFKQHGINAQAMDKSSARLKDAQASVEAAEAGWEEARTALDHRVLKSPMNGIVVDKLVSPGDFCLPGLPATLGYPAGRILMKIYNPEALWFEARIPERFSQQVIVGKLATVDIPSAGLSLVDPMVEALPEMDEATRILTFTPRITPPYETSRTFTVRFNLPSRPALKLGMMGQMRFVSGQRHRIEIPETALVRRGQLDTLFVISNDRARLRLVRGGQRNAGTVEILSGLAEGERVISNPGKGLRDGDSVETRL